MTDVDFNLLNALDALLTDCSVTGAARRLGVSTSAMSRTLARLRAATGDPLLVRAGRTLVPTPHACELASRVPALAREAREVLTCATRPLDLATLDRCFTIRANEGFVALFSGSVIATLAAAAPHARLRFAPKPEKNIAPLRAGDIDLEIGTADTYADEMHSRLIFRDDFVGAARIDHPIFDRPMTAERYAAAHHVVASRRGAWTGPVDDALSALGLNRAIVAIVPGFLDALAVARQSDLIALVPRSCTRDASATPTIRAFDLPLSTPHIAVHAMWHPRQHADPAHRWFREAVLRACQQASAT